MDNLTTQEITMLVEAGFMALMDDKMRDRLGSHLDLGDAVLLELRTKAAEFLDNP